MMNTTIDLTQVIIAALTGVITIVSIVATALVNSKIKDANARAVLDNAVTNGAGAMLQAAKGIVTADAPKVTIPGIPATSAVGVQYVLDHAGDEAARFGVTPEAIADKLNAKVGVLTAAPGAVPT